MVGNVFKQAKIKVAGTDERFKTVESVAFELHDMSREGLYMIEQDNPNQRQADPSPFDVVEISRACSAASLELWVKKNGFID